MTDDEIIEAMADSICRETCAIYGEPSCWSIDGIKPKDNPACNEPGCHALACAAFAAARPVTECV